MPKAGVGRLDLLYQHSHLHLQFQSIYAQSRRWKNISTIRNCIITKVSIHLCPKQALEDGEVYVGKASQCGFNPFMPKAGVGSLAGGNEKGG